MGSARHLVVPAVIGWWSLGRNPCVEPRCRRFSRIVRWSSPARRVFLAGGTNPIMFHYHSTWIYWGCGPKPDQTKKRYLAVSEFTARGRNESPFLCGVGQLSVGKIFFLSLTLNVPAVARGNHIARVSAQVGK